MRMPSMSIAVAIACALSGCQQQDATGSPAQADDARSPVVEQTLVEAQPEADEPVEPVTHPADDEETWSRITRLYEQAKSSGATAATSASDWLGELYDDANEMRIGATDSSLEWIEDSYAEAQRTGETSATSARDWVTGDLSRIGAWEYKTLVLPTDRPEEIAIELNKLGADRWECFWVDRQVTDATFYFKKPGRSYLRNIPARELFRLLPLLPGGGDPGE